MLLHPLIRRRDIIDFECHDTSTSSRFEHFSAVAHSERRAANIIFHKSLHFVTKGSRGLESQYFFIKPPGPG